MFRISISRYALVFGRQPCVQQPTQVWRWWVFSFLREARVTDIDKKARFKPGTQFVARGITYRYCKAGSDIKVGGGLKSDAETKEIQALWQPTSGDWVKREGK